MKQKIQENNHKQQLVQQVNDEIGEEVEEMLSQEMEYYLSSDKDKLKVPPYVSVKRIERPGVEAPANSMPITKKRMRGSQSPSRSPDKSRSRSPTKSYPEAGSRDKTTKQSSN